MAARRCPICKREIPQDEAADRHRPFCSRRCDGHGRRKTIETVAVEMLRQIERAHAAAPDKSIVLHAAPVMARWLDAHDDDFRAALAKRGIMRVRIEHRSDTRREHFSVETT